MQRRLNSTGPRERFALRSQTVERDEQITRSTSANMGDRPSTVTVSRMVVEQNDMRNAEFS